MKEKTVFLQQDNAPLHKSIATMVKQHKLQIELLSHPLYSPDLLPGDNYLFANPKKNTHRKQVWLQ